MVKIKKPLGRQGDHGGDDRSRHHYIGAGATITSATRTTTSILLPRRHRPYYDLVDFYRSSSSSHFRSHRSSRQAVNKTAAVHYPSLFYALKLALQSSFMDLFSSISGFFAGQRDHSVQSPPSFFVIALISTSVAPARLVHRYPPAFDLSVVQDQQLTGQQQYTTQNYFTHSSLFYSLLS